MPFRLHTTRLEKPSIAKIRKQWGGEMIILCFRVEKTVLQDQTAIRQMD